MPRTARGSGRAMNWHFRCARARMLGFESKDRSVCVRDWCIIDSVLCEECKRMTVTLANTMKPTPPSVADDPRWARIVARDKTADGHLWYSVSTTGVLSWRHTTRARASSSRARRPKPQRRDGHIEPASADRPEMGHPIQCRWNRNDRSRHERLREGLVFCVLRGSSGGSARNPIPAVPRLLHRHPPCGSIDPTSVSQCVPSMPYRPDSERGRGCR
jgi:hypothetical protein